MRLHAAAFDPLRQIAQNLHLGRVVMAEILGAPQMVFVKDVDGIYEQDPKRNPDAKLIEKISATELLERNRSDLPIEREVLRCLEHSRLLTSFRVINGLEPDNLRAFLEGDPVGTLVHKSAKVAS